MSTDARPSALLSHTERRGIVRDAVAVLSSSHLATFCGIIQNLVVLAVIPPRLIGIWTLVRTVLEYGTYSSLGANRAAGIDLAVAAGSGDVDRVRRVGDVTMTLELLSATLIAVSLGLAGAYYALQGEWSWSAALFAGAAAALVGRYYSFSLTVLRSLKKFPEIARARVFGAMLELGLFACAAYLFGFLGLMLSWVIAHLAGAWFVRAHGGQRFAAAFDAASFWPLLRAGAPLAAEAFALSGLRSVDRLVIAWCVSNGTEQLGWYKIALMFGAWTFDQSHLVANVIFPRLGETFGRTRDVEPVLRLALRSAELMALALAICAAGLLVAGVPFVEYLLPAYRPGLVASSGLVAAAALLGISMPLRHALLTVARTRSMLMVTAAAWLVALVGGVMILRAGSDASGAALGRVAWNSAGAAAVLFISTLALAAWSQPRLRAIAWRVAANATFLVAGIGALGMLRGQWLEQCILSFIWCLWPAFYLFDQLGRGRTDG